MADAVLGMEGLGPKSSLAASWRRARADSRGKGRAKPGPSHLPAYSIQGEYKGHTGGKAPAWEVIATPKAPERHPKARGRRVALDIVGRRPRVFLGCSSGASRVLLQFWACFHHSPLPVLPRRSRQGASVPVRREDQRASEMCGFALPRAARRGGRALPQWQCRDALSPGHFEIEWPNGPWLAIKSA
jgi:hypothetical protein